MTRIKVIHFSHIIHVNYNMNLLTNCCVTLHSFKIVFLDKRKTSAASLALVVSSTRTDVKTSFGGKERRRLIVVAKIDCN